MKKTAERKKPGRMSDAAVQSKTGKTWPEWFKVLDAAGARKMSHQQIVAVLSKQHGVGPWWQQMVTVVYEQERGLREKYETAAGYQVSRSVTVAVPLAELFAAWDNKRQRARWLKEPDLVVRKATLNKSMRITWPDGRTNVEVSFYAKGDAKSQVAVQHNKLADAKDSERKRAYWGEALERLKEMLGG